MTFEEFGATEVTKHGDNYNEASSLAEQYPFSLCPECLSQDTNIVDDHFDFSKSYRTGDYRYHRRGIFYDKLVHVNYICNQCHSEWTKTYLVRDEKRVTILSNEIDGTIAAFIIFGLLFILAAISTVCFVIVASDIAVFDFESNEIPLNIWLSLSVILTLIFWAFSLIAFLDI